MKKKSLISGIFTVMFFTVAAKLLSFFIELIVAYRFGATTETDIYYLVLGIIQILTPMITVGIWKVFMPAYKERQIKEDTVSANKLTNEMMLVFTVICTLFVVFIEVFPGVVIKLFAPGFTGDRLAYANMILRIMSPMLVFITMAVFHSAILQANREFAKSQIKYVYQHIPTILYLILFSSLLDIKYLSVSLLAGEVLGFIMAAYYTRKEYHFSLPRCKISSKTKQVLKLVPAACLNSVINQINHIVDKAFGSILETGSLTYLTYGNKLVSLFDGVVTTAFSTAFFPHLAELNAKEDRKGLKEFLGQYIMTLLCVLIPVMFIMILYSNTIVKIVFGHGQFDDYAVSQTSLVLLVYSIGLIAMGMNTLFNDVFYIKKRTNILALTNIINILINLALDFLLVRRFEIFGLCLATTLSLYISMVIKMFFIKSEISFGFRNLKQIGTLLIGCLLGSIVPLVIRNVFHFNMIIEFIIGASSFALIYGLIVFRPGTDFNHMVQTYILKRSK